MGFGLFGMGNLTSGKPERRDSKCAIGVPCTSVFNFSIASACILRPSLCLGNLPLLLC